MSNAFAGSNYASHFVEAGASAIPGMLFGIYQQDQARDRMQPWADRATDSPGPRQAVPYGRGEQYMALPGMNPQYQAFLANAGIGGVDRQGNTMFPRMPGQTDIASALLQGSSNRFATQQQLQAAQEGAARNFADTLQWAGQNAQQGQSQVEGIRQQGQNLMGQMANQGQAQIAGAQIANQQNLAMNLQSIQGQLDNFQQQAGRLLAQAGQLRGDALRDHANQSAEILNGITTGVQQRLAAQKAEIDQRPDIPPAQREAMKQRLEFVNGSEVLNTAVQVTSQEAMRRNNIMAQHNQMISSTLNTITSAAAAMGSQATAAASSAFQGATQASIALAEASAQLGQSFSNSWANWTATTTQMAEGIRSALTGLQLQGRRDLYDMVSSVQRAYVDLSPELMDLMGLGLSLNEAEYNRSVNDYNVQASMYGLTQAQAMPFFSGAASSMTNALYADYVTRPMQNAAANRSIESSGAQAAGTIVGAMIGSDSGSKTQPYSGAQVGQVSAQNPYGLMYPTGMSYNTFQNQMQSDRFTKEGFRVVNTQEVLRRVTEIPVSVWRYKVEPIGVQHIGPMAQDFHAAFGLGNTDRRIFVVDAVGVLMASVQALNEKVEQLQAEVNSWRKRYASR